MNCHRIQRKRTKGWRMPENTVYVGRGSKWGNPFKVGDPDPDSGEPITNAEAVRRFTAYIGTDDSDQWIEPVHQDIKNELAGKNLACWCSEGEPCHADVLLEIANR